MIKDLVVNLNVGGRDVAGPFAISIAEAFDVMESSHNPIME